MDKLEKSNGYFVIAPNILFDEYYKKIGMEAVGMYLYLLRRRGSKQVAYPSIATICKDCGIGRGKAFKLTDILIAEKLIIKESNRMGNKYRINDKSLMINNLKYYKNKDYESDNYSMPEVEMVGEVVPGTDYVVPESNDGSTRNGHKDRNNKKETIKKETKGVELPDSLNNTEFLNTWDSWNQYRKEIKKSLKPTTTKRQILFLSKHPNEAIEIMEQSIMNGWTGLFQIKGIPKKQPSNSQHDINKDILTGKI